MAIYINIIKKESEREISSKSKHVSAALEIHKAQGHKPENSELKQTRIRIIQQN